MPFSEVMDENYCFHPREKMIEAFKRQAGIENPESDKIILTCQRGITACIIDFALKTLGN